MLNIMKTIIEYDQTSGNIVKLIMSIQSSNINYTGSKGPSWEGPEKTQLMPQSCFRGEGTTGSIGILPISIYHEKYYSELSSNI